ncbi:30S ribosomal protein S4 [Candidatus Woesearchaeota archaeon]|nr:30S ribosomal protein S4 [Candidatus Woesearchaeota archaeon]
MGDPNKQRRKYSRPEHPWKKDRIKEERALVKDYGLKNMEEIWKMRSFLSNASQQVKKLTTMSGKQAEKQKQQLMIKLKRYGLINQTSHLTEVLSLSVNDVMERRLQTLVHRNGLAKSMKQARQFITHEHIFVEGKKITIPSYLVSVDEEKSIAFSDHSPLSDDDHPERTIQDTGKKPAKKKPEPGKGRKKEKGKDKVKASKPKKDKEAGKKKEAKTAEEGKSIKKEEAPKKEEVEKEPEKKVSEKSQEEESPEK